MQTLFQGIDLGEIGLDDHQRARRDHDGLLRRGGRTRRRPADQLAGTIQADILKEYIAQKEWCFPVDPAMRLMTDLIEWCTNEMPRWHPVSISGYHIREAGSTAAQELAFTLKDGLTYVEEAVQRGLDVDDFAPRLSFFFNAQIDFFDYVLLITAPISRPKQRSALPPFSFAASCADAESRLPMSIRDWSPANFTTRWESNAPQAYARHRPSTSRARSCEGLRGGAPSSMPSRGRPPVRYSENGSARSRIPSSVSRFTPKRAEISERAQGEPEARAPVPLEPAPGKRRVELPESVGARCAANGAR